MAGARDAQKGALCALVGAALFGLSAPLVKRLLPHAAPGMLAGLLYLGAGLGLSVVAPFRRTREARLARRDLWLLFGLTVSGGIVGPLLLVVGLQRLSAVSGALLLNLEAPLTMLLAVALFGEHLGRRAALAALVIVVGAGLLSFSDGDAGVGRDGALGGALALAGACLSWALDNNLTQRLSVRDPIAIVRAKTLVAGAVNVGAALALGAALPSRVVLGAALLLGLVSYGASVVLDVYALRLLGAAREAAYFATAPFVGALFGPAITGEPLTVAHLAAGAAMALGVALLLRERHGHRHTHEALEHEHLHVHDEHHQHAHPPGQPPDGLHSHPHHHEPLTHDHPHVSDLHHRHRH